MYIVFTLALLLTDELDTLREYMAKSLFGAALDDEAVRTGLAAFFSGVHGWKTDEGYCYMMQDSMLRLLPRCVMALLEKDTEESRAALRAWLPPAAELMRIAEHELAWLNAHLDEFSNKGLLNKLVRGFE